MVEKATNMQKYQLVGLNHEIIHWPTAHKICPPLTDQWDRDYDPSDLFESEKWIASVRYTFKFINICNRNDNPRFDFVAF